MLLSCFRARISALSYPLSQSETGAEPCEPGRLCAQGALEPSAVHQRAAATIPDHLEMIRIKTGPIGYSDTD